VNEEQQRLLLETRACRPWAIPAAAGTRRRRPRISESDRLLIIAADHTARGIVGVGDRPTAMASRFDLLDRILVALSRPGVHGFLGTADLIEDLLVLGALDEKIVFGSMNRGGIPGAVFEMDDRFTGFDAATVASSGLDGGKMLLRIDPDDHGTIRTLATCSQAVSDLAAQRVIALVEPFMVSRRSGRPSNDLAPDAVIRSAAIASGLGSTSAYSWLKLPVVDEMPRVAESTTLPILLLGGDAVAQRDEMFARWEKALRLPTVRGLVVGRNLLYPPDDDVAAAVDIAASLL
jgi:hypothetical protein